MDGWIKLHKKIKEHWMWDDPVILKAWLDILLSVNYTDKKILFDGNLITVEAGQIITSVRKLASQWKCSKEKVNKILTLFSEDNMLTVNKTTRRTLLTVVNYGIYQNGSDSLKDTDKDSVRDTGKDTDSPQHKNNKEYKEDKNNKKSSHFVPPSLEEVAAYCSDRKNGIDPESFIAFYQSKGWMIGKNKMKDWKAAVRTWEQRDRKDRKVDEDEEQRKQHGTDWTDHFFDCK